MPDAFSAPRINVVGRVGVQAQVAVIGVAEAAFEFGAVVAGGFGQPEGEGVAGVVRAQVPSLRSGSTALQVRAGFFMASHPLGDRGQNVAIGLTGLPDVPAKRTGATARWKSHWPSSAAVVAHASRSQLSSIHRPMATRLTA